MIIILFMKKSISLLLNILWLYSVNATISVRDSRIEINDSEIDEKMKTIQKSFFAFNSKHEILMHSVSERKV